MGRPRWLPRWTLASHDNGRIHKNSNPARIIAGDRIDGQWRADSTQAAQVAAGTALNPGPNHDRDASATMLFVDGGVQQVLPTLPNVCWQPDANYVNAAPSGSSAGAVRWSDAVTCAVQR